MTVRLVLATTLLLIVPIHAFASSDSNPTTQPDSPRQALRQQDAAAHSGNLDADLAFYEAKGADQENLAHAMAEADVAVARLQSAVAQKFGKELGAAVSRAAGTEDIAALDSATEQIEGDHAEVKFKTADESVPMVKADGRWKISLAEWTKGQSSGQIDALAGNLKKMALELNKLLDLVQQDKFRSGEGVRDRVQELRDHVFGGAGR